MNYFKLSKVVFNSYGKVSIRFLLTEKRADVISKNDGSFLVNRKVCSFINDDSILDNRIACSCINDDFHVN